MLTHLCTNSCSWSTELLLILGAHSPSKKMHTNQPSILHFMEKNMCCKFKWYPIHCAIIILALRLAVEGLSVQQTTTLYRCTNRSLNGVGSFECPIHCSGDILTRLGSCQSLSHLIQPSSSTQLWHHTSMWCDFTLSLVSGTEGSCR